MILSYRRAELSELDAHIALREILHPHFRLQVVDNRNVVNDDALFLRQGVLVRRAHLTRPVVTVLLAGEARVRAFGREQWLAPGDVSVVSAKSALELREQGESFRSLVFEWDPQWGFGTPRPEAQETASLGAPALARLRAHAEQLLDKQLSAPLAASCIHDVLGVLAAAGLPLGPVPEGAFVAEVPPQDERLSLALDRALSCLRDRPMVVDLERELDVSARHVTRLVNSFNERYGCDATTWQEARSRRRLLVGTTFMTREGATTDLVAKRVGYASSPTFCRALGSVGLPSPTRVRDAVRALG
jgi:hypothetical protein